MIIYSYYCPMLPSSPALRAQKAYDSSLKTINHLSDVVTSLLKVGLAAQ